MEEQHRLSLYNHIYQSMAYPIWLTELLRSPIVDIEKILVQVMSSCSTLFWQRMAELCVNECSNEIEWVASELEERNPGIEVKVFNTGDKNARWLLRASLGDQDISVEWTSLFGYGINLGRGIIGHYIEAAAVADIAGEYLRGERIRGK